MQFGFTATMKSQHAIKKNGDARQAHVQKPFQYSSSAISAPQQGNEQVGRMQNIAIAYFWL